MNIDETVLVTLKEDHRQAAGEGGSSRKVQVSWDVILCRWANKYRRFEVPYLLNMRGQ